MEHIYLLSDNFIFYQLFKTDEMIGSILPTIIIQAALLRKFICLELSFSL